MTGRLFYVLIFVGIFVSFQNANAQYGEIRELGGVFITAAGQKYGLVEYEFVPYEKFWFSLVWGERRFFRIPYRLSPFLAFLFSGIFVAIVAILAISKFNRRGLKHIPLVFLGTLFVFGTAKGQGNDRDPTAKTGAMVYLEEPRRKMSIYYPLNWMATDKRSALVIFRCNIPDQREHFRKLGMVVIKPQTAPVNSGNLPKMSLEEIAKSPKPRDQVADTKSAIRFIRQNSEKLGIDPKKIVATGTSGGGDLALQSHLNHSFEHETDDRLVSCSPDALVLYCPAFDGIDLWFVKSKELLDRIEKEAPAFKPHLDQFFEISRDYATPLDHRASLLQLAEKVGAEAEISQDQITGFQEVLKQFNERDWQLLHPVEDALKMSASRILTKEPLPPTLILHGTRDHLIDQQAAFIKRAREMGQQFEVKLYQGAGHSFMMQPAFAQLSTADVQTFLDAIGMLPNAYR